MMLQISTFLLIFFVGRSLAESDYFRAAVFEHRMRGNESLQTPTEIVQENLNIYEKAAEVAAKMEVDIIVFPEYSLFPFLENKQGLKTFMEHLPDPKKSVYNPCDEKEQFHDKLALSSLSCIAQKHRMYVVANMGDIQPCVIESCSADSVTECDTGNCPKDGDFIYNTNVAFDRNGNLIARYHKNHLYFEDVNTPKTPDFVTFKTEFGVFGTFICFDSVFNYAVEFVEKYKVDHVAFPTYWFDDVYPLNTIEYQQSWALTNKVNFLAANGHYPVLGTLGSGIYSKYYGALTYTYYPDGNSKLLIADVPNKEGVPPKKIFDDESDVIVISEKGSQIDDEDYEGFPLQCFDKLLGPAENNFTDYRCYKAQLTRYTLTKLQEPSSHLEACNNGFCCSVSYKAKSMNEDYYLAAFNGFNDVNDYFHWAEESCLLVRCDPFDGKPCVTFPSKSETVFETVELTAKFTSKHVYATVSKNHNRLAPKSEWNYEESEDSSTLKFHSASDNPLLKVALMGRCYERDPPFIPFYNN